MRLTLRGKILTGFAVAGVALILLATVVTRTLWEQASGVLTVYETDLAVMASVADLEEAIGGLEAAMWAYLETGSATHLEAAAEHRRKLQATMALRRVLRTAPEEQAEEERLAQAIAAREAVYREVEQLARSGRAEEARRRLAQLQDDLGKLLYEARESQRSGALARARANMRGLQRTILYGAAAAGSGSLLVALAGIFIANRLARILGQFAQTMQRVAQGDLTVAPLSLRTRDELQDLADSLKEMVVGLRRMVSEVRRAAEAVAGTGREVSRVSGEVAAATAQIDTGIQQVAAGAQSQTHSMGSAADGLDGLREATRQIAEGATRQAEAVTEAVQAVTEMDERIAGVAREADAVAAASQESAAVVARGLEAVDRGIRGMAEVREAVVTANGVLAELRRRSSQIGSIVEAITEIAEQTNLLALNAAIEAARAGESGRGFAVVADEVRRLAARSGQSAGEIAGLVNQILAGLEETAAAMDVSTRKAEEGAALAGEVAEALKQIRDAVARTAEAGAAIRAAAGSLRDRSAQVARAVHEAAAITEENAAASEEIAAQVEELQHSVRSVAEVAASQAAIAEEVSAGTRQAAAAAEGLAASARTLARLSDELQAAVARFRLPEGEEAVALT
ncbi:MAG: HAMP domain-containing methyl-accepting chemotaxis protein [Bacillota bacterium]|nr:MAG: hypothetical protein DIU70_05865 [Bacillota bacterium]